MLPRLRIPHVCIVGLFGDFILFRGCLGGGGAGQISGRAAANRLMDRLMGKGKVGKRWGDKWWVSEGGGFRRKR